MSDLVILATFSDAGIALVTQSYLRAHGIDAFLPDDMVLATQPFLGLTTGGYRLLVPENQAAEAQRLLDAGSELRSIDEQQGSDS